MPTYTARLHLAKMLGTEPASIAVLTDLIDAMDAVAGLYLCTEGTKPTSNNYPGRWIKCTDTLKHYVLDGTGVWVANVYTGGAWVEDYYVTVLPGAGNMIFGNKAFGGGQVITADASATTVNAASPVRNGVSANLAQVYDVTGSSTSFTGVAGKYINFQGHVTMSNLDNYTGNNSAASSCPKIFLVFDNATEIQVTDNVDAQIDRTTRAVSPLRFEYNWLDVAGGAHTIKLRVAGGRTDGGTTANQCTIAGFNLRGTISA